MLKGIISVLGTLSVFFAGQAVVAQVAPSNQLKDRQNSKAMLERKKLSAPNAEAKAEFNFSIFEHKQFRVARADIRSGI